MCISESDERMRTLINFCIWDLDGTGISSTSKILCAERLSKGWQHAVHKFRRAANMKMAKEGRGYTVSAF